MSTSTVTTRQWDEFEGLIEFDHSPGRWYCVPAQFVIAAPTRAAADDLAEVIARERLPRLLDFIVKDVGVVSRQPVRRSSAASVTWVAEVGLALKAETAEEARRDVEGVCRRDMTAQHLFVGFGRAREIPSQENISPMCRRFLADAAEILVDMLEGDLVDFDDGAPFEQIWGLSYCLPPRFKASYDRSFIERWLGAVEAVGLKLLQYPDTYLASTAEELAAHAIIEQARAGLDRVGDGPGGEQLHAQLSEEIEMLHSCAFEDHDILMAFEGDSCPADNPAIAEMMGIANFTPDEWFTPFRPGRAD